MIIKELIKKLSTLKQDNDILLSSDEELNTIYRDIEICEIEDENKYCLFGLSGSEEEY